VLYFNNLTMASRALAVIERSLDGAHPFERGDEEKISQA
jgi:hypothetical protein